jgi:hypothetical protein
VERKTVSIARRINETRIEISGQLFGETRLIAILEPLVVIERQLGIPAWGIARPQNLVKVNNRLCRFPLAEEKGTRKIVAGPVPEKFLRDWRCVLVPPIFSPPPYVFTEAIDEGEFTAILLAARLCGDD